MTRLTLHCPCKCKYREKGFPRRRRDGEAVRCRDAQSVQVGFASDCLGPPSASGVDPNPADHILFIRLSSKPRTGPFCLQYHSARLDGIKLFDDDNYNLFDDDNGSFATG
jgi:hypothetical protein